jgi:DNA polymerase-1
MAHLSEDPGLVEAFRQGLDIHTATAARVFGVDPDLVSGEMRRMAKVINFGLLYGMESFGLAQRLGSSRDEAKAHMEAYFSQFPDVKAFLDGVVTDARRMGFTSTLFGRRRYLPELKSDNFRIRQMGERMALNAPIQGTAADIIKKAMIDLEPVLGDGARMLLQIHDELIVECPVEMLDEVQSTVREVMEGVVDLRVPLVVDVASGDTLDAVKG